MKATTKTETLSWIVCTMTADMREEWSVYPTFREGQKAHDDDVASGAYSSTICAVLTSTDYDPHPVFHDPERCVECGAFAGRDGLADGFTCDLCSEDL